MFYFTVLALVRRLYDSHHIRSDVLNNWNKTEDLYGRTSRSSFKVNFTFKKCFNIKPIPSLTRFSDPALNGTISKTSHT